MNQRKDSKMMNETASRQQHSNHPQQQQLFHGSNSGQQHHTMNSRGNSQFALNGKDLIIRMLAEVFQVNQLEDGQVKWQQVSSSLVPISLYSRTTSRWLNFLLAASSSNSMAAASTTASAAMSPDSRDFLILLQQFHQQQQMDELTGQASLAAAANNNLVIFQVVAHDYCDGQCRKILNVKIAQPGTRLGQASDFFVYWKEQRHMHQHQQQQQELNYNQQHQVPFPQSSFASTHPSSAQFASAAGGSTTSKNGRQSNLSQNQQQPSFSLTHKAATCCQALDPQQHKQTWGLNFASVNDAKLFYDICSLNLVDLNFNSEYLKQLASNDMRRELSLNVNNNTYNLNTNQASNMFATMAQEQPLANNNLDVDHENKKLIRDFLNYKQRRSNISSINQAKMMQQQSTDSRQRNSGNPIKRQLSSSSSKCQSCKRMIQQQQQHQQQIMRQQSSRSGDFQAMDASDNVACPIHFDAHAPSTVTRQGSSSTATRMRSRSSTRHQELAATGDGEMADGDLRGAKRARSFSTPASPDKMELQQSIGGCPVHTRTRHQSYNQQQQQTQESSTDCERQEAHHPRCLNFMRQQELQVVENNRKQLLNNRHQLIQKQHSIATDRPKKPVRGVLRDSTSRSRDLAPSVPVRQSSANSNLSTSSRKQQQLQNPMAAAQKVNVTGQEYYGTDLNANNTSNDTKENFQSREAGRQGEMYLQAEDDRQVAARFATSRAAQRRSTTAGGDQMVAAGSGQQFDANSAALANRNARQARAQYANSKNMKEFLSLDAGGQQSTTPVQLATALNERFQQKQSGIAAQRGRQQLTGYSNNKLNRVIDQVSTADINQQHSSTELQISIEKTGQSHESSMEAHGNVLPAMGIGNEAMHNVATTTDDLPLDPNTRRRMFKLTSEEVISERTEPRSLSTPSVAMEMSALQQQPQTQRAPRELDNPDRQARAVSLEPDVERDLRRRHSRTSASGRRRSLERTTCVDLLDNAATGNGASVAPTHFKKTSYRLSPIESSNGSQLHSVLKGSATLSKIHDHHHHQQQQQQQQQQQPVASFATLPKRQRTRSSGAADRRHLVHEDCCPAATAMRRESTRPPNWPEQQNLEVPSSSNQLMDPMLMSRRYNHQCSLASDQRRLLSYKSVPDFSRIHDQLRHGAVPDQSQLLTPHWDPAPALAQSRHINHQHQVDGRRTYTKHAQVANNSNLSSYEVPLCLGETGEQSTPGYGRQSRSCPNSLRRKRRDFHHLLYQHHQPQLNHRGQANYLDEMSGFSPLNFSGGGGSGCPWSATGCRCSTCLGIGGQEECQATMREHSSFHGCSLCMMAESNELPAPTASYSAYPIHDYPPRSKPLVNQHRHHQHHQMGHYPSSEQRRTGGAPTSGPHPPAAVPQHWRPCSSQSSKSPLHYGLYESDCEDNERIIELNTCSQARQVCCLNGGAYLGIVEPTTSASDGAGLDRPVSGYGIGPQSLRPVLGYDQTMARTALKSRQRAKSQPPDSEDAIRLNKSMENVQKLITEVQIELSLMKSSGSASVNVSGSGGTRDRWPASADHSGGRSQVLPLNQTKEEAPCGIKMSNEEKSTRQPQQQQQMAIQQLPSTSNRATSATRRAGQFKCVGAIRKAGFLSVKKWILKRRQSIELARKQGWKRYWVCLRGTALLFHSVIDKSGIGGGGDIEEKNCTDLLAWIRANCCAGGQNQLVASLMQASNKAGEAGRESFLRSMAQCYIEREPRHLIIIEGAIVQPIPEHPKRDYVYCLSTTFGDAYLFQASCQLESDNWISAMHNACAASLARDLTRDEAMKLFESKVRHLELEAEKKLFLKQRLESRLTTMSSIGASMLVDSSAAAAAEVEQNLSENLTQDENDNERKVTLRSLLYRLNQQLVALDTYLEQVHCEIYQLRCYLSSCGAQQMFYQSLRAQGSSGSPTLASIELPHPKSLLMHVSKSTKLMLIKLGVFTVSSFHAYIHARQGSADSILQRIQLSQQGQQSQQHGGFPLELRLRAQSISEKLLTSGQQNRELETNTEQLIHLANLRVVSIHIAKNIYKSIRLAIGLPDDQLPASDSDDRHSAVHDGGDSVIINLKLHSSSSSASIIKQVLKILGHTNSENSIKCDLTFTKYYLRLRMECKNGNVNLGRKGLAGDRGKQQFIVAKRRETLSDWSEFEYLELMEKVIFRVQLTRRRLDEAAAPFGIAVGAQLFVGKLESQLNVYCSYIEWGSEADKAGLRDEDELIVINGIPVMDLDMMFVECIMQDEQSLKLVVRSCSDEYPANAEPLDGSTWRPADGGAKDSSSGGDGGPTGGRLPPSTSTGDASGLAGGGSQVISDEYISSLVCPPPPAKSSAFLRTSDSSTLLRQKSDMANVRLVSSKTSPSLGTKKQALHGTKSQQDLSIESLSLAVEENRAVTKESANPVNANQLASQLLRKSGQLTRFLMSRNLDQDGLLADTNQAKEPSDASKCHIEPTIESADEAIRKSQMPDPNSIERLKKSILELLETEYAYIRHLETISDHYMVPLEENSYLNIADLRLLSQSVLDLIGFQRDFFDKLTASIWAKCEFNGPTSMVSKGTNFSPKIAADESEDLNKIVKQLELFKTIDHFKPLILSLAKTFISEADRFKIYAAYCVAFSRLEKFLHPKRAHSGGTLITSIPIALDTFMTSGGSGISASNSPREFFKPLGSFMANNSGISLIQSHNNNNGEFGPKLRQLSEFLGNLDSSSSSASLSLPKTSQSDNLSLGSENQQQISVTNNNRIRSPKNSVAIPFQRSVHQQNFESYLIKPIQRIVKYPMLLNSIAASAQIYKDEELDLELQIAVKQMGSTTSYVNDAQWVHDEFGPVFGHIERQFFGGQPPQQAQQEPLSRSSNNTATSALGAHQPHISLAIEQLLYFGPVTWLNINEFTQNSKLKNSNNLSQVLFVFESCVVFICKEQIRSTGSKKKFSSSSNTTNSNVIYNLAGNSGTNSFDSIGLTPSATSGLTSFFPQKSTTNSDQTSSMIRYQTLIPVSEVQVRSVPTSNNSAPANQQHPFQWELFRCSSVNSNSGLLTKSNKQRQTSGKVYLLSSANNETRNAFLRKIRFIIRESVRNMSLPLARSPSSKSLTPKKMSSPSLATNTNSSCSTSLSPVCNSGQNCKQLNKNQGDDGCEFGANQVCDNSYKTSIEVNN